MRLSDFSFDIPQKLIAQTPLPQRSASRLLELDGSTGELAHYQFSQLPSLLKQGDLLVLNDTQVIPARLFARKISGGKLEVMLERILSDKQWLVRMRASRAPKPGTEIVLPGELRGTVQRREDEFYVIAFECKLDTQAYLEEYGHIPLPPYIQRPADNDDQHRYQTVYSQHPGALAAPTAGLHFDEPLFERLSALGIKQTMVTLHVGAGTFQPIRTNDPRDHKMHSEQVEVSAQTVDTINRVRERGGRVIAVGTTCVRSLESAAVDGELKPFRGDTRLFITPGTGFRVVDGLITNFHLPESTLILLVAAFAGHQQIMHAYEEAIRREYRFYSYGDAMLLWPDRAAWKSMSEKI